MKLSFLICVLVVVASSCGRAATFADSVQQPLRQTLAIQQQAQRHADDWEAQRLKMMAQLRKLQLQEQQLTVEKSRLKQKNDEYRQQNSEYSRAIEESRRLSAQMDPFLHRTLELLTTQVADDLPFNKAERRDRLQHLEATLADDSLSLGEKFRRLMEAVNVEIEYGRNVEVTQRTIELDGRAVLMNQLRLGRLALFAQSLDGKSCFIYSMVDGSWRKLDSSSNREIARAVEMGLKHRPVDLLTLPVGRVVAQ